MDAELEHYYASHYPKSQTGKQCLGPCYEKGHYIIHPITMYEVSKKDNSFCPIEPVVGGKEIDDCFPVTSSKANMKEIEINMTLPHFEFTPYHFLKLYYQITSHEETLVYINENSLPYYTEQRLMDAAWHAYGSTLVEIDSTLINYYVRLFRTRWAGYLLSALGKYVMVKGELIKFGPASSHAKLSNESYQVEKTNYLLDNLINHNVFHKFLEYYLKEMEGRWSHSLNHSQRLRQSALEYLEQVIQKSIGKK